MEPKAEKADEPKRTVTCFLCGEPVELRSSKRGKPYFICDPCGLQAFIRKDRGISKLGRLSNPQKFESTRVLDILASLDALNSKLADTRDQKPLFTINPELELAEKALLAEKARLEKELRGISGVSRKPGNSKPRNPKN